MKLIIAILLLFSSLGVFAKEKTQMLEDCKRSVSVGEACEMSQIIYNFSRDRQSIISCINLLGDRYILCKNPYLAKKTVLYPNEFKICIDQTPNLDSSCSSDIVLKAIRKMPNDYTTCINEFKLNNSDCSDMTVLNAIGSSYESFLICIKELKKTV